MALPARRGNHVNALPDGRRIRPVSMTRRLGLVLVALEELVPQVLVRRVRLFHKRHEAVLAAAGEQFLR